MANGFLKLKLVTDGEIQKTGCKKTHLCSLCSQEALPMDVKWQSWDILAHYYIYSNFKELTEPQPFLHMCIWIILYQTLFSSWWSQCWNISVLEYFSCFCSPSWPFWVANVWFLTALISVCPALTFSFLFDERQLQAVQRTEKKRKFTEVGKKSQSLGSRWKGHNQLHKQGTKRTSAQLSSAQLQAELPGGPCNV